MKPVRRLARTITRKKVFPLLLFLCFSGWMSFNVSLVNDVVEESQTDWMTFPSDQSESSKPQVQMLDLYNQLKFDNPNGGVWKQGFDIQVDPTKYSDKNKLKVFAVPHSHNDPGWIETLEEYYQNKTKHIFNTIVKKIPEKIENKFIWAEISFLDLWWKEANQKSRDTFKELVSSGQIEIVTGGWVMNDEANTHYFAMIEQLKSGHEWVKQKLNVSPRNGWAIDPFGLSSSMAYLLKRSGFENMVIQRVHYAVKKELAARQNLEFRWRQNWDSIGKWDINCHMLPFNSYAVMYSCGPDPIVCCAFEFRNIGLRGVDWRCPANVPAPDPINDSNVEEKARLLLDQLRKKSTLFQTNAVLFPIGDDFTFGSEKEFDQQFINYQKLFDYMNSRADWMVEAKFGTLKDYFDTLHAQLSQQSRPKQLPSLSGDFFTYADIDDSYWSGYFTTRPFYKQLERVLESYLRSAEILYSLSWSQLHRKSLINEQLFKWMSRMMGLLVESRHNLGVFQHHDGITGTARQHVVQDYARKMQKGIQNSQKIIEQCAHYLLRPSTQMSNYIPNLETFHFLVDTEFSEANKLPKNILLNLDSPKRVVLYNSLASERIQVITLHTSQYNVQVCTGNSQSPVRVQISPVFNAELRVSREEYEISFLASIPPLGMTTFIIKRFDGTIDQNTNLEISQLTMKTSKPVDLVAPFSNHNNLRLENPFVLKNSHLKATFDTNGLLSSISQGQEVTSVAVQFVRYGTQKPDQPRSGAYLFFPDGPAKLIKPEADHPVVIIQGSIRSQVFVRMPYIIHKVELRQSPGVDGIGLHIDNQIDLGGQTNLEVAMRLITDIQSGFSFYSDLNGLQMTKRKKWEKLPLQAQFYPMPSMAYIEDGRVRMTLATRQPLGVASLESGQLEVMHDRRLNQDDGRGLPEGITDNVIPTINSFRLLLEPLVPTCTQRDQDRPDGYPSLSAHKALHELLYPVHRLIWNQDFNKFDDFNTKIQPTLTELGSDVHLVNLRTGSLLPDSQDAQPSMSVSLVLHRFGCDWCYPDAGFKSSNRNGQLNFGRFFGDYFGSGIISTSLTSLHQESVMDKSTTLKLNPMEIYTYQLEP